MQLIRPARDRALDERRVGGPELRGARPVAGHADPDEQVDDLQVSWPPRAPDPMRRATGRLTSSRRTPDLIDARSAEAVERDAKAPSDRPSDHVRTAESQTLGRARAGAHRREVGHDLEPPGWVLSGSPELFRVHIGGVGERAVRLPQRLAPSLDLDGVRRPAVRRRAVEVAAFGTLRTLSELRPGQPPRSISSLQTIWTASFSVV